VSARLSPAHLALTLAVVVVWGFAFVPIRIGLNELPPFMLAALRFLLAALPAVFFVKPPDMPWKGVVAKMAARTASAITLKDYPILDR